MKYAFIHNHLVGNIVDEAQLLSCPADHTAVELQDGESCGIFWLFSPTGNPRFIPRPNYNEGIQNLKVVVENDVPAWLVEYKSEAEIISHLNKLEKEALDAVKEKLIAKEKERLYNENLAVINALSDTEALERPDEYPPFNPDGHPYKAKNETLGIEADRFYYPIDGKLYKVISDHNSQSDWLPGEAVSLYVEVVPPGVIAEWVQPTGAHDAYEVGVQVTHNGHLWENTSPANVYEPGVYGWTDLGAV